MNSRASNENTPWYRQFWPWFIVAILLWGVVSASVVLAIAIRNPPHMMTGDYAKLGKALVDTHRRADRAEALGLAGVLVAESESLSLRVEAHSPGSLPDSVLLLVQHPTDSSRDRQVVFNRVGGGQYRAPAIEIPPRGRLIVSDLEQSWWISSSYQYSEGPLAVDLVPERL